MATPLDIRGHKLKLRLTAGVPAMTDRVFSLANLQSALAGSLTSDQVRALKPLLAAAQASTEWMTARGIKDHLAAVIDGAQRGRPQLIKRAHDQLPTLVISLESVAEAIVPRNPISAWEAMHGNKSAVTLGPRVVLDDGVSDRLTVVGKKPVMGSTG